MNPLPWVTVGMCTLGRCLLARALLGEGFIPDQTGEHGLQMGLEDAWLALMSLTSPHVTHCLGLSLEADCLALSSFLA